MPSTYTDKLGLELQETGEGLNAWGLRLNNALTLVDDAIAGIAPIALTGNYTLTNTLNMINEARKPILLFTDGGLNAAPTVTLPPVQRLRYVENRGATYAITFTAGGVAGVVAPGRKAFVLCNGADTWVFDPKAEVAALTDAANASAVAAAASKASAAASEAMAQKWASNPENSVVAGQLYSALHYAAKAAASAAAAALFDPSSYYTKPQVDALFGNISPILPITMTSPASGATDVGAGGTYTFVARAFAGDTTGFYSNYGVPVASRFVNVYEPGGTVPVKTFTAAGGGPSLVANFTGSGLVVSHAYQFEFGYTDAQGNTVKSPKVSATTAGQFKPSEGQAYQGGFLGFQNFGDGDLFDLVVAPKSTEASRTWNNGSSSLLGAYSRLNGPANTPLALGGDSSNNAQKYAASITIGGVAGYLGAIDELRAISSKLKPSAAVEAAFKTGGAEAFTSTTNWSSTELSSSSANLVGMVDGSDGGAGGKASSFLVRAIKRVPTGTPYPIGTAMEGGYLAAYFTDLSSGSPVTYMLIVADKATEVTRAWGSGSGASTFYNKISRTSGVQNFNTASGAIFPATDYCDQLVSGGKTDWYLGAIDEMLAIARMNSQLPSAQQLVSGSIWTSTEADASTAKFMNTSNSSPENTDSKSLSKFVRPIRRVLLPAT